mmetsp:Transcript_6092/g.13815  ORF Transcript_6092/g.13815 Transcript_6092/m.13815 type:complete len:86 (-) Transcript_6092:385-642(-)
MAIFGLQELIIHCIIASDNVQVYVFINCTASLSPPLGSTIVRSKYQGGSPVKFEFGGRVPPSEVDSGGDGVFHGCTSVSSLDMPV